MIVSYTAANPEESAGRFATPEEYVGYEVLDPRYQRIGSVKELLVSAGKELEYVRVRVGLFGLKSVLIPVQSVWVDEKRRIILLHQRSIGTRRIDD
jgi:PRC-barrel domain